MKTRGRLEADPLLDGRRRRRGRDRLHSLQELPAGEEPGSQLALFASYSYHGFITDRDGDTLELHAERMEQVGTISQAVSPLENPRPCGDASSPWPDGLPARRADLFASSPGGHIRRSCELTSLTALSATDPTPPNSRPPGPRVHPCPVSLSENPLPCEFALSANQLSGLIPPELGEVEHNNGGKLEGLYLYANNCSGFIPRNLLKLLEDNVHTAIKELDKENRNDGIQKILPVWWERAVEGAILPTYGLWLPPRAPLPPDSTTPFDEQTHVTDKTELEAIKQHFLNADNSVERFPGWGDSNFNRNYPSEEGCGAGRWHGVWTKEVDGYCRVYNLSLDKRELIGGIPTEVGDLGALEELNLSKNYLSGMIPPELGNVSRLKVLGFNQNPAQYESLSLSGEFHPS